MKNLSHKLAVCLTALFIMPFQSALGLNLLVPVADITVSSGYIMQDEKNPSRFYAYAEEPAIGDKRYYIKTVMNYADSGFSISNSLTDDNVYAKLGRRSQENMVRAVHEFQKTARHVILQRRTNIYNQYSAVATFSIDDEHQLNSKLIIRSGKEKAIENYEGGFLNSLYLLRLRGKKYLAVTIVFCGASACSSELRIYLLQPR